MSHDSGAPARLLRPATPATSGTDFVTQDCITCHDGGTYVSPSPLNVMAETAKISHPLPSGTNFHDAAEPAMLNSNRHATCVDCHNAHAAQQTAQNSNQFANFPPPALRPAQAGVTGISAVDGVTVLTPAINQYENCLRCHGLSTGKKRSITFGYAPYRMVSAPDPLNLIPQFAMASTSSHPVTHPGNSPLPQPSLLPNMLNLNGTPSGRQIVGGGTGALLFCTDCHNSDDNREFGGSGPNGPHGSVNTHILERNYQFSQAASPGGIVTNLFPNPDLSIAGPYAMCAKCHNLSNVLSASSSFPGHVLHVSTHGFSCSVCHTAHGMGGSSPTVSGERLVNFDANVVAQNGAAPISYHRNGGTNSCALTCHEAAHNANGTVSPMGSPIGGFRK